ncbi:MAG: right-handed parallel beta-helix repeat-containing protein [Anaerolineae bacterium]|uniref:right-handed parallel beta-helix repeat-containing protein n=1 Tax=Candidatus Amarolinea dominans TaxID=3140696 RepID=UPI003135D4A9|nr:right-handed parallel beta-helix repeat-containing protein [Anaerolineae bacterium]
MLSALPQLTRGNITIDGSHAGVILDGALTPCGTSGFCVISDSNVIKGLKIVRFPTDGVQIANGARSNQIGGDWRIGSAPRGQGNIITLNGDDGVDLGGSGTMHNIVTGNLIGVDADGTTDLRIQAMAISPAFDRDQTLFHGHPLPGRMAQYRWWRWLERCHHRTLYPRCAGDCHFAGLRKRSYSVGGDGTGQDVSDHQRFRDMEPGVRRSIFGRRGRRGNIPGVCCRPPSFCDHRWDGHSRIHRWRGSWAFGNAGISDNVVHAISLSPPMPATALLFAVAWEQVYRSTNRGQTWQPIGGTLRDGLHELALSPNYAVDHTLFVGRIRVQHC